MEQHAEEMSSKMAAEREIVRQENKLERDDLQNKVCSILYNMYLTMQTILSSGKQKALLVLDWTSPIRGLWGHSLENIATHSSGAMKLGLIEYSDSLWKIE